MAGAVVGAAFLSGFISVVSDRLISSESGNLVVSWKLLGRKLVERLKTALVAAEALIADAEQKQIGNELVRKWLDSLKDAVYTADDLLELVLYKAATQKTVRSFWLNREERQMVDKIEVVVKRIEDLARQKDILGLEKIPMYSSSWRTPSTSLVKGNVYGRDDDQQALIKMLRDNNDHQLSVISIVGMGGMGKTTLAQCLYNNKDLTKGFDLKAWVCVSDNFDVIETTKKVIREISLANCSLEDFNSLQHDLIEKLSNKKFFIVLDDVWSDDADKWSNFMVPFQYGEKGSIVLLTTRDNNVTSAVQDCRSYFLNGLSENYCWLVFADNASFPQSNESTALEEIGRKIVKKCDGLPLAAETFGRKIQFHHNYFVMHNLLRDLAIFLAGEFYCNLEELGEEEEIGIQTRYLTFGRLNSPNSIAKLENLTTSFGMHKLVNLLHLDVRKTALKEMPRGISKLKDLQFLSSFVVGKHEDNGIEEVGGLVNLHGSFEIKKLENVVDVRQARSARMMEKRIDELCLEWSLADDVVQNTETEREILDSLQPHNDLKVLKIKGYKGAIFSDWLGNSAYNNMTSVSLLSCRNCCMLPSLGQLSSLKSLRIESFDQLREIGMEFYKNEGDHHSSHIPPFPTLETLEFHDMPCWEEWHLPDFETFPRLQKLQLRNCPMLKGDMLNAVFSRMVSSLPDSLKVRELHISEVPEGWNREMILNGYTLSIKGCVSVVDSAFKAMSNNHLSHLQELNISGCGSALSIPANSLPRSLQKLKIMDCRKLKFPQQQPQHKYDLVELQIEDSCHSLTSLSLDSFPSLQNLEISLCRNLESISISEAPKAALQRLTINGCHKLVSFAGEGLAAPNLTHLSITYCDKLEALPSHMNTLLPSLHSLCIGTCQKICKVPEGGLPPNLKELLLEGSDEQIKELSWMANLGALTKLTMDFSCVRSFTQVGLLPCLPSLTTLHLCYFQNLETLECNQLLGLTSLQQLHISYCPKLEKMEGEKLPSSLSLLKIQDCDLLGEHCKNKHEPIWPKISHIPTIEVNGQQISE
ncbi:Putative disease resistance RPP13-like protein [Arachis hypogaea]|nr:Putative disease resistance RPP13-like protein [Arachis hypogaea]